MNIIRAYLWAGQTVAWKNILQTLAEYFSYKSELHSLQQQRRRRRHENDCFSAMCHPLFY